MVPTKTRKMGSLSSIELDQNAMEVRTSLPSRNTHEIRQHPIPKNKGSTSYGNYHVFNVQQKAAVQSLNRCRIYLGALFLSDIATADGKYLEQLTLEQTSNGVKSKYKFPQEEPTRTDWKRWRNFWTSYTMAGRRLQEELGTWKNPYHRTWRWFYNKDSKELQRVEGKKYINIAYEEEEPDKPPNTM